MNAARQILHGLRLGRARAPRRAISPRIGLAVFAALLVAFWTLDLAAIPMPPALQFALQEGVLILGVPIAVALWRRVPLRFAFRLNLPSSPRLTLWLMACTLVFIAFYYYFTFFLGRFSPAVQSMIRNEAHWILLLLDEVPLGLFLAGGLLVAFAEEMLFRGFFLRSIEKQWNALAVCALCGFCFSAIHLNPGKLLPVFFAGTWFSYLALRAESLWPCVAAHFLLNFAGFLLATALPHAGAQTVAVVLSPPAWGLALLGALMVLLVASTERFWRRRRRAPEKPGAAA